MLRTYDEVKTLGKYCSPSQLKKTKSTTIKNNDREEARRLEHISNSCYSIVIIPASGDILETDSEM